MAFVYSTDDDVFIEKLLLNFLTCFYFLSLWIYNHTGENYFNNKKHLSKWESKKKKKTNLFQPVLCQNYQNVSYTTHTLSWVAYQIDQ